MGLTRLINIGTLYGLTKSNEAKRGKDLAKVETISDAFIDFKDGNIHGFGSMGELPNTEPEATYDVEGGIVYPSYIDCHTHLVFAQNREEEFVDRIKGLTYQEIAKRGGGILNSVEKLRSMSEDQLYSDASERLHKLIKLGTGAIEIKSGYGLNEAGELKMLRVIKRLCESSPIPIKATFLGAHAFPTEYATDHDAYVDTLIDTVLPEVARQGLADYVDAFCEDGYFSVDQTKRIVEAGLKHGLRARLHVNQFKSFGAIEMAANNQAISVEHLEEMTELDVQILAKSDMFGVALPACSFFLKIPYTPARKLIDAQIPFVLASDFNPGSSPTGNLNFVMSLACIHMQMLPDEALNALTINAANALEVQGEVGSIAIGKRANVIVCKSLSSINAIPYQFGENLIDDVFVNGEVY
ncbi:MAG: imidazolonepropionase [Bacteroidia bacterium]|jgi:imidazolonepropionase